MGMGNFCLPNSVRSNREKLLKRSKTSVCSQTNTKRKWFQRITKLSVCVTFRRSREQRHRFHKKPRALIVPLAGHFGLACQQRAKYFHLPFSVIKRGWHACTTPNPCFNSMPSYFAWSFDRLCCLQFCYGYSVVWRFMLWLKRALK